MRMLRIVVLLVVFFLAMSIIVAIGRAETGPLEKVVLGVALVGLIPVTSLAHRLGRHAART